MDAATALDLYNSGGMGVAVRRYEACWLPLLAKCGGKGGFTGAGAPLDVAWAWLMHLLAPSRYRADVQSITGTLLEPSFLALQGDEGEGGPEQQWL